MGSKVLVLNQDYSAFNVCTVSKAFLMVYLDKAELIAHSDQKTLRSISKSFNYPVVIRLTRYIQRPYKPITLTRENIFRRDKNTCQYCGARDHLTIDHVIPKSRGGKSQWDNLVTACKRCNSIKGDLLLEETHLKLSRPAYKPNFIRFIRDCSDNLEKDWLPYLHY